MSAPPILKSNEMKPQFFHNQSNTFIKIPANLSVVNIGKQNDSIPPNIDVSSLINAEVVSRIHAKIWVQGDAYFIENVGSANGTFLNNTKLETRTRYHLSSGDKIDLGKGNLVTFIFQFEQDITRSEFRGSTSHKTTHNDEKHLGGFFSKLVGKIVR